MCAAAKHQQVMIDLSAPIYLCYMRVPFEWLMLSGCLLPLVRFALDRELAADLRQDNGALLGWRLPRMGNVQDAVAALSGLNGGGNGKMEIDVLVAAFDAALRATALSGVPDDLFYRVGLSFLNHEYVWEKPSLDGECFSEVDRAGGRWEANLPW